MSRAKSAKNAETTKKQKFLSAETLKWIAVAAILILFGTWLVMMLTRAEPVVPEKESTVSVTKVDADKYTQPPLRISENKLEWVAVKPYTLKRAAQASDLVAHVRIGNWLSEDTEKGETRYEAEVLEAIKGDVKGKINVVQKGSSKGTYEYYPLFAGGNELLLFLEKNDSGDYAVVGDVYTVFYMAASKRADALFCVTRMNEWNTRMPKTIANNATVTSVNEEVYHNLQLSDKAWSDMPPEYGLVFSFDKIKDYIKTEG